jgi:hypothetical protein
VDWRPWELLAGVANGSVSAQVIRFSSGPSPRLACGGDHAWWLHGGCPLRRRGLITDATQCHDRMLDACAAFSRLVMLECAMLLAHLPPTATGLPSPPGRCAAHATLPLPHRTCTTRAAHAHVHVHAHAAGGYGGVPLPRRAHGAQKVARVDRLPRRARRAAGRAVLVLRRRRADGPRGVQAHSRGGQEEAVNPLLHLE